MHLRRCLSLLLTTPCLLAPVPGTANPLGEKVVSGDVSVERAGSVTTVIQGSDRSIIAWESFDIGAGETTRFVMPSSSSMSLNRVAGDPTKIFGTLSSNGQVWIINPSGILFGSSARIDVAGIAASSLDVGDRDFLISVDRFDFKYDAVSAEARGGVVNRGTITVAETGYAALIAPQVENSGVISAPAGKIGLGAGRLVTLDLYGDRLLRFRLPLTARDIQDGKALISNSGDLLAMAGVVQLSAAAIPGIVQSVVNTDGVVRVGSVTRDGGKVILSAAGGATQVAGVVSARSESGTGGSIDALGDRVIVGDGADIDASGAARGGRIRIGGGKLGQEGLPHADATYVAETASLRADATERGDGGDIVVWSDQATYNYGQSSARGGAEGGDGGSIEISSKGQVHSTWRADVSAQNGIAGSLIIDPTDVEICAGCAAGSFSMIGMGVELDLPVGAATTQVSVADLVTAVNNNALVLVVSRDNGSETPGSGNIVLTDNLNINITGPAGGGGGPPPPPPPGPGGGPIGRELVFDAQGDITINGDITITGVEGVRITIQSDGIITVNGSITSNNGPIFLNGSAVVLNQAPNAGAGRLSVIERGDQSLSDFLETASRVRTPGPRNRGETGPRGKDQRNQRSGDNYRIARSTNATVRSKFEVTDSELLDAAEATNDSQLQGIVADVLDILNTSANRVEPQNALPFSGKPTTVVEGVLAYDPGQAARPATESATRSDLDGAPVLFGSITF